MVTRRQILKGSLGLVLVTTAAGIGLRARQPRIEHAIEKIVVHYLGADRLHPDAARSFAADYAQTNNKIDWRVTSALALGIYFLPSFRSALPDTTAYRINRFDRYVISDFLVSSTYDPAAPSSKQLKYVAYNVRRACNPFARYT